MLDKPFTDNQVYECIANALQALGSTRAETVRGNTALIAARRALALFQLGLLRAENDALDAEASLQLRRDLLHNRRPSLSR